MRLRHLLPVLFLASLFIEPVLAGQSATGDLDSFMAKVLTRRKVSEEALKDYVLNDVEQVEAIAPGDVTVFHSKREYLWYVRDGIHVRSPVRIDGVAISKDEIKKEEDNWIKEEQQRAKKKADREKSKEAAPADDSGDPTKSLIAQIAEPRFISEAYFLQFKLEKGNYYLAGKEKFDGRDVLVIEYYPTDMFNDDKPDSARDTGKKKTTKPPSKTDQRVDRQMNKTSLVTLWIDPVQYQIVKYTFSNVWIDFLPAAWMMRVDHLKASMEMSQALPGVWLPRNISFDAGVTIASGLVTVKYDRKFSDYKRAEVTTTIRPPDQE